jgi:hypothetical protein
MEMDRLDLGWGKMRIWLLFILLQSIGIRLFPYQGVLLGLVLCLTMLPGLRITRKQILTAMAAGSVLMLLSVRGVSDYSFIVYFSLIFLAALLYTCQVQEKWHNVEFDLYQVTFALTLHGLIGYILYFLIPNQFALAPEGAYPYQYFAIFTIVLTHWEPARATGLCWEPGLFQYVANISLFLGIKHSKPWWKLALPLMAVLASHSTTGYLILIVIFCYTCIKIIKSESKAFLAVIPIPITVLVLFGAYFLSGNVFDKLDGENTSGLIRMRDTELGWELIRESPFIGHGINFFSKIFTNADLEYLMSKRFSSEFLAIDDIGVAGYTNGFLAVFVTYGVIVASFLYWSMFRTPIIQGNLEHRVVFVLITVVTFFGEPITYTAWFYMLVISGYFARKYYK